MSAVTSVGLKWIAATLHLNPVQPLAVESGIGPTRRTVVLDEVRQETYPPAFMPAPSIGEHLKFALKYEVLHLEFLARLFQVAGPDPIEAWIRFEPSGAYARRVGFLYEWLTGLRLAVDDTPSGNYVDALDAEHYLVAGKGTNVPRWRVRDNMPGTREFCPIVYRSQGVQASATYDCAKALRDLEVVFGADILLRSAVWLTIKESRASFAIEHEEKKVDRVRRFATVMETRCGIGGDPLQQSTLEVLQKEILGAATRYGVRASPVFVGHTTDYENIVDYIGPHWDDARALLAGLQACMAKTVGQSAILRATVASFGFVFIHPMSDGNGRISRFLVNDVLRRDGAVPAPFILPISATITNSSSERVGYDRALEHFSRPLMRAYGERYYFGAPVGHADGVDSHFEFDAYVEALPVWRYPDLTFQAAYLGRVIKTTIEQEMRAEADLLRSIDRARLAVKQHLEGPNTDIDQIIRSVRENGWKVSGKLKKHFPRWKMASSRTISSHLSVLRWKATPTRCPLPPAAWHR
jgi:hypothetical protein